MRKYNTIPNQTCTFSSFLQSPRLLSPGSGAISARYGWSTAAAGGAGATAIGGGGVGGAGSGGFGSMASTPEEEEGNAGGIIEEEDEDSGTGSTSNETHVIRHIDRNILACQICLHRYRLPKVMDELMMMQTTEDFFANNFMAGSYELHLCTSLRLIKVSHVPTA